MFTFIMATNQRLPMPVAWQIRSLKKHDCLLFFLLSLCLSAWCQPVYFKPVLLPEGASLRMINGMTQDQQGYMWFAAYETGLHRYDGYRVLVYQNDPNDHRSLASNDLEAVYADRNGMIWIGTQRSGLDRLDPATGIFTHFRHVESDSNSLSDDRVTEILEDHEGTLWVGTINGLNQMDRQTGRFTRYYYNPGDPGSLSCSQVQVLYEDRSHTLWIGTASFDKDSNRSSTVGGLNRLDKRTGKFIRYLHSDQDPYTIIDNRVAAIFEDNRNNFWVLTPGDGLHRMNRATGSFERYRYDSTHPEKLSGPPRKSGADFGLDLNLFFVREDAASGLWIAASGGRVARYDLNTGTTTHYNSFNGDVQGMLAVTGAFLSREGILWMSTWVGRIYHVNPFQGFIQHVTTGNISHVVHQDISGMIWIGTFHDGLIQYDPHTQRTRRFLSDRSGPFILNDRFVDAIYETADSTLWIGSEKGLYAYDRRTQALKHYKHDPKNENSLPEGCVTDILEVNPGALWLATCEGLEFFDIKPGVFKHYRHDPGDVNSISHNASTVLLKDHSGNIWIGNNYGVVNRFDPITGKFQHFTISGSIGCITEDSQHVIWVGSSNGLFKSNSKVDSFERFTDARITMTPTTVVTAILEDDQQNLWIASSAGIVRLSANRDGLSIFRKSDGVDATGFAFFLMKSAKGKQGEFLLADNTGYYTLFPGRFKSNPIPPQIVITDFRLAAHEIKPAKSSPLKMPISQTREITLAHDQDIFSFDFAAIHFGNAQNNLHFFKLENFDDDWRKAGGEKTAYYYKVPPGKYIFRVKAANSDGVCAEKSIAIIIKLPWWRTWWAYLLYVVGFGIIVWGAGWYRSRRLKAENIFLEEKVIKHTSELEQAIEERYRLSKQVESQQALLHERLRISRELHDDIGSTLGSISIYSEVAKKRTEKNENAKEVLLKIGLASRELIDKMSDIVWSLNPNNESFEQLQNRMMTFAAMMLSPRHIRYDFVVADGVKTKQFAGEQRKNIFLIFKEALYNIVKYAACSVVNNSLTINSDDHLVMTIKDDGKGFDVAACMKDHAGALGGNGIKNMHARAGDIQAKLCIHSIINKGTTVQLDLSL